MADEEISYIVVANDEEQHSIWPVGREIPAGWYDQGFSGQKDACLRHIEQVWPDIRPLSVRRRLAAAQQSPRDAKGDPVRNVGDR